MRLSSGRLLTDQDVAGSTPVTVINETMAKRFFENEQPIGQRILIEQIITGRPQLGPEIPWEVVGVVADEKVNGLDNNARAQGQKCAPAIAGDGRLFQRAKTRSVARCDLQHRQTEHCQRRS
jgi:hypothetical protein